MELENKVMNLYENILEPVKARKIVLMLKYAMIDKETDLEKYKKEIPISEETMKKYINDDNLMLKYLTPVELSVFRERMNKVLNVNYKLKRLINLVLVQNIKDIEKLKTLVPISTDTMRKYLSDDALLSKYLTEVEKEEFLSRLEGVFPKAQRLIKVVMVDGITDLDKIEKLANIKIATIRHYLENQIELKKYLTGSELNMFVERVSKMLVERDKKEEKEQTDVIKKIVDDIFNTRYKYREICERNFCTYVTFESYLYDKEFMKKEFPEGTFERVKEKINENDSLRRRVPRDCFVIEDRFCIMITKKDIYYLNQFDTKRLNLVSEYLGTGANFNYVKEKYNMSEQELLTQISSYKLQDILDEKYYIILKNCLKIENLLLGNELQKKKEFILNVINFLEQNNFDNKLAMVYFGIPEPLFNKVLFEIVNMPYATEETKNIIKSILNIETNVKSK